MRTASAIETLLKTLEKRKSPFGNEKITIFDNHINMDPYIATEKHKVWHTRSFRRGIFAFLFTPFVLLVQVKFVLDGDKIVETRKIPALAKELTIYFVCEGDFVVLVPFAFAVGLLFDIMTFCSFSLSQEVDC